MGAEICLGEIGGSGQRGGLDKGAEVLTFHTKECRELLVISDQGKQHKINYSLGSSIQVNLGD